MYSQTKFPNGLKLIILPAKNTRAVTILILLPVGSRYETKQLNGTSHFIEHMMFKGTKGRPNSLALSKELDSIGAQYNAFTGEDHTGYWVKTIDEKMEVGFDVLSDMLFNSIFDSEELQRERGVICQEIKMCEENPMLYIGEIFQQTLYQGHALGRSIAGTMNTIKCVSRQSLLRYKEKFYRPSQMVVVVAGNVKKSRIISLIKRYFSASRGSGSKVKCSPFKKSKDLSKSRIKICFRQTKQVQIALGGFTYPYSHPKTEVLELLSIILGGNMSSRLFTEVRVKRGLAYYISSHLSAYQDIGDYAIIAGVDKQRTLEAIEVILNELKKIEKEGATAEELSRAKDYFKGTLRLSLEDSSNLAGWYAKQFLLAREIVSPKEKLRRIKKVSREDIKKVAHYLFSDQGFKLALIGPFKDKRPLLRVLGKGV